MKLIALFRWVDHRFRSQIKIYSLWTEFVKLLLVTLLTFSEVLGSYPLSDDEVDWQPKFNEIRARTEVLKPLVCVVDRFIRFFVG